MNQLDIANAVFTAVDDNNLLTDHTADFIQLWLSVREQLPHDCAEGLYSAVLTAVSNAQQEAFVTGWTMRAAA